MDHQQEPDGINEALAGTLRVALTVAGQLAERAARTREQAARDARAHGEQQTRELRARLDAERAAARAALAPVAREAWWQRAEVDEIARAWETAQAWRELDADARHAAERIHDQLHARYAIDTTDLRADPAALAAPERADRERARDERHEAAVLLASADRADADQHARRDHEPPDAADHVTEPAGREILAAALHGVADEETVEARVIAATNQAQPASEAVTAPPQRVPRARHARRAARIKDRSRSR
jgi:colicin import membrane protein